MYRMIYRYCSEVINCREKEFRVQTYLTHTLDRTKQSSIMSVTCHRCNNVMNLERQYNQLKLGKFSLSETNLFLFYITQDVIIISTWANLILLSFLSTASKFPRGANVKLSSTSGYSLASFPTNFFIALRLPV